MYLMNAENLLRLNPNCRANLERRVFGEMLQTGALQPQQLQLVRRLARSLCVRNHFREALPTVLQLLMKTRLALSWLTHFKFGAVNHLVLSRGR
jgi:hypothetical protein